MKISYKNTRLERILIGVNILTSAVVAATFVLLFGFDDARLFGVSDPLLAARMLYVLQVVLLCAFIIEKILRFSNAVSKAEFWRANWFEVPLFVALAITMLGAGFWFAGGKTEAPVARHLAVGIYLVIQVTTKLCRTCVELAASGRSPAQTLMASFVVLILCGAGLLMLPRAATGRAVSLVDALFTATSAACVTGLTVKNIGQDFSLMGQVVILGLIQLGGLGIVVFGAVYALLVRQALSLRESVAMQDLLSAGTLSRIGNMIAFVFVATVCIEGVGAVCLFGMWDDVPGRVSSVHQQWFCSIFHSISAFCNAGLGLFSDNLMSYSRSWGVYIVICPLIILGGFGFGVLYDLASVAADRVKRFFKRRANRQYPFSMQMPKRMQLQSKIVLTMSALLIVLGAAAILLFERYTIAGGSSRNFDVRAALFQSITARTAGFNTVDIASLSAPSKFVLILLMFIGGSPGSTAGGIKTVTLAVVLMTVVATLRRRGDVELFRRSVPLAVVGRAITVTVLFGAVLFGSTLALSITESSNSFTMLQIIFEAASALGTVGLSAGVTGPSTPLTAAGKLIIMVVMVVGRLGPLTLLTALTFNLKPARYNYPEEVVVVG